MNRIGKRFAGALLAAGVASSLALGATAMLAQPGQPARAACPVRPGYGEIGVACSVNGDCTAPCQAAYPESPGGSCSRGCCICPF